MVCLEYAVRQLSLFKLDLPKVVNSCFPKVGTMMTPSIAKKLTSMDKKKLEMATAAKKNNKKKNPHEESCGVVELVQDMLVLTCMYKLILCMFRDVRTITT